MRAVQGCIPCTALPFGLMSDLSDLSDTIDSAAAKPKSVTVDGSTVTAHTLKELDDHYDRKANREAAAAPRSIGVKFFNTSPPGAT